MELLETRQAESLQPPLPLDALVDRVRREARRHTDFRDIPLRHTRLRVDGTWMFGGEVGRLSRLALGQLCSRLELPGGGTPPAGYLARCPGHLAAENLNHWLSRKEVAEQRVLIRTRQEKGRRALAVRAILSDRYATVDHLPLLETLAAVTPEHGLSVQGWSLDDAQLTLRLTVGADHPASLKDPIRVGLLVRNSEVGLGRISVSALLTRLVCSNGLVVNVADLGGVHRRHIGRTGECLEAVIRESVPLVLTEADEAARRFVQLREAPLPQPAEDWLLRTAREADMPETLLPAVTASLEGETLYDGLNAFTNAAQRLPVAERVRVEEWMSRLLAARPSLN